MEVSDFLLSSVSCFVYVLLPNLKILERIIRVLCSQNLYADLSYVMDLKNQGQPAICPGCQVPASLKKDGTHTSGRDELA